MHVKLTNKEVVHVWQNSDYKNQFISMFRLINNYLRGLDVSSYYKDVSKLFNISSQ